MMIRTTRTLAAVCAAALLLVAPAAYAALHSVNWIPPDQNVDGSALIDLAGYQVLWGDCVGTKTPVGNAIGSLKISNPAATSAQFTANAYPLCIVMYAVNAAGRMSDPTNVVQLGTSTLPTLGQPKQAPPQTIPPKAPAAAAPKAKAEPTVEELVK